MPSYTNLISSINVQCLLHTTDLNHLPYLHILQTFKVTEDLRSIYSYQREVLVGIVSFLSMRYPINCLL